MSTVFLIFLMLFVVFCPLIVSESGDDDLLIDINDEDVTCSSILTVNQTSLTCSLNVEPTERVKFILCSMNMNCVNAIQGPHDFTFPNLTILATYELQIEPGQCVMKNIKLAKCVKIPAPQIKLATYKEDSEECFISIQHNHFYVQHLTFEVKVLEEKTNTQIKQFDTTNRNITISKDALGDNGVYSVCVRAKPEGFFDGMWSEWSSKASFTIKSPSKTTNIDAAILTCIITAVFLLLMVGFVTLRWKTHIKDFMKPKIPYPKTTLAQIQRGKEGFPFIFSPELFRDAFIHRVDYVDEKPSTEELQEGLDEHRYSQASLADFMSTSICEMETNEAELLAREQSHLKIGLLSESDIPEEREGGPTLKRECKDEAYVTMSSLFKTQRLD